VPTIAQDGRKTPERNSGSIHRAGLTIDQARQRTSSVKRNGGSGVISTSLARPNASDPFMARPSQTPSLPRVKRDEGKAADVLAPLHALAIRALQEHRGVDGRCRVCQDRFPCQQALLAEHALAAS
jgi:hypothetical protein